MRPNTNISQPQIQQTPYGVEQITTLWLGNVLPGTTDYAVAVGLCTYGDLINCFLTKNVSQQGQLSGFAKFSEWKHAQAALEAIGSGQVIVNGSTLAGKVASKNVTDHFDPNEAGKQRAVIERAYFQAYLGMGDPNPTAFYQPPPAHQQVQQPAPPIQGAPASASAPPMPMMAGADEITSLWIGNMFPGSTDRMVAFELIQFGEMLSCFLHPNLSPQGQMSGFVRFKERDQAVHALEAIKLCQVVVNGSPLSGKFATKNCSDLKSPALAAKHKAMIEEVSC